MRSEDLLDQCLQALASGQELPAEVARYLSRHPEQRAEIEDLLFAAQRVSRMPSAELSPAARKGMQSRLAERLGFEPAALDAPEPAIAHEQHAEQPAGRARAARKKPLLPVARLRLSASDFARSTEYGEDIGEARIRAAFRDLTPEDIRRYIGVRGEDYLYYRQRLPGWEPVFSFLAIVLRGFKRLERLTVGPGR